MKSSAFPAVLLGGLLLAATAAAQAPAGPPLQLNTATRLSQNRPDVARTVSGKFVVVWRDEGTGTIKARLFRAPGIAESDEIVVAEVAKPPSRLSPHVAAAPDGRFAVVWEDGGVAYLRRFDAQGAPLGAAAAVHPLDLPKRHQPDVAVDGAGRIVVVWAEDPHPAAIYLRRFGFDGAPLTPPERIGDRGGLPAEQPRVAANAAGDLLVSWPGGARLFDGASGAWGPQVPVPNFALAGLPNAPILDPEGHGAVMYIQGNTLRVLRLAFSGIQTDQEIIAGDDPFHIEDFDAALEPGGNVRVVWNPDRFSRSVIFSRTFDPSWHPLGPAEVVSIRNDITSDAEPAVASLGTGSAAIVWTNAQYELPVVPGPIQIIIGDGEDGSDEGVFGTVVGVPTCIADAATLCLGDGRFAVQVAWKTPAGQTGAGRPVPLTRDTGAFWFFDAGNLELMLKVLDARTVNGYFWVFYGSLSNLEYTVTVRDVRMGREKVYKNNQRQFASRGDVNAFPSDPEPADARIAEAALPVNLPGTVLPLVDSRFQVEVSFVDPRTGLAGQGQAVPLTDDTGSFWFFDRENLEVMIKVLDGRASNGHFWVFCGGLSDVEYTFTVRDTFTGKSRIYRNVRGQLLSRADVEAF